MSTVVIQRYNTQPLRWLEIMDGGEASNSWRDPRYTAWALRPTDNRLDIFDRSLVKVEFWIAGISADVSSGADYEIAIWPRGGNPPGVRMTPIDLRERKPQGRLIAQGSIKFDYESPGPTTTHPLWGVGAAYAAASWTTATKLLYKPGAFVGFKPGDYVQVTGGTHVTAGIYQVAGTYNENDGVFLTTEITDNNSNQTNVAFNSFMTYYPGHEISQACEGDAASVEFSVSTPSANQAHPACLNLAQFRNGDSLGIQFTAIPTGAVICALATVL